MESSKTFIKPLVLACIVALGACSSGGDSAAPAGTTTISGLVEAPNGQIAQFENNKSILVAATDLLFPAAYAGITGLDPVGGATVELIRIDDDGNQVGDVLASTVTSVTGNYNLALPTGVSLAGNLIVRITGNSGASMSAMVVEQAVDINPVSQYLLDKFVDDDDLVLADLALNEVVALQDRVEEFDLTATADLSSMLMQLDAELGGLVDTEIAVIESTPDDGAVATALTGTWNTIEIGMGMHDSETEDYGTFSLDALSEGFTLAAGANAGDIDVTVGVSTFLDTWTNFSVDSVGNASIYHESSVTSDADSFTASIDSNGNVFIEFPFEEELQTVDTNIDTDGPDFGWRWPPGTITINNVGNNNAMVFVDASAGARYETTDTNNDGVKDAINPNAKSGDEVEAFLGLMLKQGSGMSATSLDGDYGIVTLSNDLTTSPSPSGSADSTVGVVNFNTGTATVGASAFDDYGFERAPNSFTDVVLTDISGTDGGFSFPYTVSATGQVTLDPNNDGANANDLEGWSNDDGSVFGLLNVQTSGSAPNINSVSKEVVVGVKLGASAPAMGDAIFKLYPLVYGAEETGLTEMATLRSISSLAFNAGATTATADFTARGYERATDIASVEPLIDGGEPAYDITVNSIDANGAISMSFSDAAADENESFEGFVSADGKMMVLRFNSSDDTTGEKFRALGMVIGIRQ